MENIKNQLEISASKKIDCKHPYYIVSPRYKQTSAGVRVLYRLADVINKLGGSAFVFLSPSFNRDIATSPMDVAPFLTKKIVDHHFANGITPIVIYPEATKVSNLNAPVRVRYMLSDNLATFTDEHLQQDDYVLFFNKTLARKIKTLKSNRTVFLPVSDPNFFCPSPKQIKRSGGVFYAGKYKYHFNGKTFPITNGMVEITRDQPDSQTPEQIRELFRSSEWFFSYEDTSLALEAILCGCPVVYLPSEYFKETIGGAELSNLGYAWGAIPEKMQHAQKTVEAARVEYMRRIVEVNDQVLAFIEDTQSIASSKQYVVPFAHGLIRSPNLITQVIDMVAFLRDIIADKGVRYTLKIAVKRLLARRFSI